MSYCFNPTCKKPQNSPKVQICSNCNSPLLLIPPPSDGDEEIETKKIIPSVDNNSTITNQSRYRILKLIGYGGFGRTFLALDEANTPEKV